ncbi:SDR family oxidoreductase [Clostridium coskatii]|uniref:SDR family oxidoreductase n=1 Tax=Clostridium coskatii TaxID=1705578 RepID=UPI00187CEFD4|nr:SDR family oxidoreductase [Clostridium coskatii]
MKRVLIVGASGFLGKELYKAFKLNTYYETYGTYFKNEMNSFEYLSMMQLDSIKSTFDKVRPNIVIITSSLTNVEYCEANKDEAYEINVIGIKNIVGFCKKYNCRVVYISTEYVFDGKNGPYDEEDAEFPINYYGKTKLEAEKIIKSEIKDYLIARTTVIYGWDLNSKNFIMQLINNLSKNKSMKIPNDQISSPTYCNDLSMIIEKSCDKDIKGVINVVGNDVIDRYRFAVRAAEILELNKSLLIPVKTISLGQIASRPLNAGLKVDKLISLLKIKPLGIDEGLKNVKLNHDKYKVEEAYGE